MGLRRPNHAAASAARRPHAAGAARAAALRLAPAPASSLDLLHATDYGMFNNDNLTAAQLERY
jgi:hypothetical protein